jgi:hemolysin III
MSTEDGNQADAEVEPRHGDDMMLLNLREPVSALSHAAGMMLAFPLIWIFWRRCQGDMQESHIAEPQLALVYRRGKLATLILFGSSLAICYGNSAVYHALRLGADSLGQLRRLDHVGIYLLIAGTYTPAAWALMPPAWRRGTLLSVWSVAGCCGMRVWTGGVLPTWISTLIYLSLGWGVLFCYRELARTLSHRRMRTLVAGGAFYSAGALINLAGWPVLRTGVFGAHELFHFFVLAGSACHVAFMLREVVPASPPLGWFDADSGTWLPRPRSLSLPLALRPLPVVLRYRQQVGGALYRRPHLAAGAPVDPAASPIVVMHPAAAAEP